MDSTSRDQETVPEMEHNNISGDVEDDSDAHSRQNLTARRHLSDCLMISAIVVVDNGEDVGPVLKKVRLFACPLEQNYLSSQHTLTDWLRVGPRW
jgi:hypothetical protein